MNAVEIIAAVEFAMKLANSLINSLQPGDATPEKHAQLVAERDALNAKLDALAPPE